MYARNWWYVVETSDNLKPGEPLAAQLAEVPLVLYRRQDGTPVVLDNRCSHRRASLALGRIEGDTLRCMYHGVRFDPQGQCVEVPGQERIPKQFCQQRYAAVERQGWIWVWLGRPEEADPNRLPATPSLDRQRWHVRTGEMRYAIDFRLMNDNLCDLSHVTFVHAKTFAAIGEEAWASSSPTIIDLPEGMRFQRWLTNSPPPPGITGLPERVDIWSSYDYVLPGIFLLDNRLYPAGTQERVGNQAPPDDMRVLHRMASAQAVTPIGPRSVRYFFSASVPIEEPGAHADINFMVTEMAFGEDKLTIEAQQQMIDSDPSQALSATQHDRGAVRFRRLVEQYAAV